MKIKVIRGVNMMMGLRFKKLKPGELYLFDPGKKITPGETSIDTYLVPIPLLRVSLLDDKLEQVEYKLLGKKEMWKPNREFRYILERLPMDQEILEMDHEAFKAKLREALKE